MERNTAGEGRRYGWKEIWKKQDPERKALADFRCPRCGGVRRMLLSLKEMEEPKYCECCGLALVSHDPGHGRSQNKMRPGGPVVVSHKHSTL